MQAQLRLLVSGELKRNAETNGISAAVAEGMAKAGTWANAAAVKAAVVAAKVDHYIWKYSATDERWVLYAPPSQRAHNSKKPLIWLTLKDQHCRILKPKAELPPSVLQEWKKVATLS